MATDDIELFSACSARCEIKPPKEEARALFYFVDEHNMPTRRDPQQPLFNDDKDTADHG